MNGNELTGAENFLTAKCHICHGGDVLSDNAFHNKADVLASRDTLLAGVVFDDPFRDRLFDFMKALTDPSSKDLSDVVPTSVPSGLSVDHP